jgi:hypothetical protein
VGSFEKIGRVMRIATLAITGLLAMCAAFPAAAQRRGAASAYEFCESRAVSMGLVHGQTGHIEFIRECMGKRPGTYTPPR